MLKFLLRRIFNGEGGTFALLLTFRCNTVQIGTERASNELRGVFMSMRVHYTLWFTPAWTAAPLLHAVSRPVCGAVSVSANDHSSTVHLARCNDHCHRRAGRENRFPSPYRASWWRVAHGGWSRVC